MISEFYENPKKPKHVPKIAHYTFGGRIQTKGETEIMANGHGRNFNEHWAKKLDLTVEEYVKRDKAVQDATRHIIFYKNAAVYPKKVEDYQRRGKCRVLEVIRSYRDWPDELSWDPEKIFVVEAYSEENKFSVFRATGGYFDVAPPKFETKKEEPNASEAS